MTYLMPNTYRKLEEYAKHPDRIPQTDSDILKLTCAMTAEPEFSRQQLNDFTNLISQKNITAKDLADNEIIQSCMQQSGFTDINAYIKSDKTLSAFIEKQKYAKNRRPASKNHPAESNAAVSSQTGKSVAKRQPVHLKNDAK